REYLRDRDPPSAAAVAALTSHVEATLEPVLEKVSQAGWDRPVATSRTARSLARLTGAAPSAAGLWVPRQLPATGLRQVLGFIRHIRSAELAEMEGVGAERADQLLAGAVVADAVMRRLGSAAVHRCPWACRAGWLLRRLDRSEPGTWRARRGKRPLCNRGRGRRAPGRPRGPARRARAPPPGNGAPPRSPAGSPGRTR